MLRKRDAYVKVLDFGLVKLIEQQPAIVDRRLFLHDDISHRMKSRASMLAWARKNEPLNGWKKPIKADLTY
jgi:hypothetical protein